MIQTISNYYNVPVKLIKSDTRDSRIVLARHVASTILRESGLKFREVAEIINCKPNNVFYSHLKIMNKMKKNPKFKAEYLELWKLCN